MTSKRRRYPPTIVTAGFAAGESHGVCYARLESGGRGALVRVEFACRPLPYLQGRDVAYYAISALVAELRRRSLARVEILVEDEHLPRDLAERRALPNPLIVPYVALRCRLNRFDEATVRRADGTSRDLTARARAEVSLDIAA